MLRLMPISRLVLWREKKRKRELPGNAFIQWKRFKSIKVKLECLRS